MQKTLPNWVQNRIVHFFNTVQKPADIVAGVQDDPGDNENQAFSLSVARRILEVRKTLPLQRFTSLAQIDAVSGVGTDKIDDLAHTFGMPASEAFERRLFDTNTLGENWTVLRYEWSNDEYESYRTVVDTPAMFREQVQELAIRALMETAGHDEATARALTNSIQTDYIDPYNNSSATAAYALALWFYRFDADNWFSFERMTQHAQYFFDYHAEPFSNMELRLFKGFDNSVLLQLIVGKDLMVTVNDAEQVITLWVIGLAD